MPGIAGPFFAAVALLGAAALAKVLKPLSTAKAMRSAGLPGTPTIGRLLGVAELAIAALALFVGGRASAALVTACYLGFAAFTARLLVLSNDTSCGCFGEDEAPASPVHVALTITAAAAAALAVGFPPGSLPSFLGDQPWAGIPFLAVTALLAWLGYVSLTLLPELQAASTSERADRDR